MKRMANFRLPVLVLVLVLFMPSGAMAGSVLSYFSGSDLVDVILIQHRDD